MKRSISRILSSILTLLFVIDHLEGVLISETLNEQDIDAYDCVHYSNETGYIQSIPYCRRTNLSIPFNRSNSNFQCYNGGSWLFFESLGDAHVEANELLSWSSGVDVVDAYAAFLVGIRFVQIFIYFDWQQKPLL